jgi:hypothetical protein
MKKRSAPMKLLIGAEMYRATVFKVEGRTEAGLPRECRMIGDAETIHVDDGDEFIVCYVLDRVLRSPN